MVGHGRHAASEELDTGAIERKLRDVQELPASDAGKVLMIEGVEGESLESAEPIVGVIQFG
jgi:hypothetical protein